MSSPTEAACRQYIALWTEPDPAARDVLIVWPDGRVHAEAFDAGEVDADGRIVLLLTFNGGPPELIVH